MDDHLARIAPIIDRIRDHYKNNVPFKVYRGATNSTRRVMFDKHKLVDVSKLNHVLHIDADKKTAVVEPNVPMDELVRTTLRHGLIPPVVMEFPGITVGGGIQGGAGESSSFKWGTFNRTINWYDIILADGTKLRTSRTHHADLFWGTAGSYGSFGVLTLAEIQLVPAKQYVRLRYVPVTSFTHAVRTLEKLMKDRPDFIDGIMFSRTKGVVMVGALTDAPDGPRRTFTKATDEWFYMHAEKLAKTGAEHTEAIPIYDYLFRYDRGAFWMGKFGFERLKTPFNRATRTLLNPLMHTRKMYEALHASGVAQECIIQDLALPSKNAVAFLDYVDQKFGIYPLWLCPLLPDKDSPFLSSAITAKTIINIGVWGRFAGGYEQFVRANQELEATLMRLGGKKWLYAQVFYDEPTFWNIYGGKDTYDALRKKYNATSLPSTYDKIRHKGPQPVSAKRGVLTALLGRSGIHKD